MEGETMRQAVTTIQRYTAPDGAVGWSARSEVRQVNTVELSDNCEPSVESLVIPDQQIARVSGNRPDVDIGEPWPDPTTPVGLSRLLAIAEGLAVTEWEKRFGGAKS